MTEIKICGLREAETLDAALEAGADYIGLVFFKPSPRNIAVAEATVLADRARGRARVVALVVDPAEAALAEIAATVRPDVVQFHGSESPDFIAAFRTGFSGEVWKAVLVESAADVEAARAYSSAVDRILFDARPPREATRPGGNGESFDWTILSGLDLGKPFVLSGGLNPDNVVEAVQIAGPGVVDVSSGVERATGIKDPAKIRAFVDAVRGAGGRQGKVA
jgi:phosphoribosylanthranilate isomerase